jgi:hypothetical protein
MYIVRDKCNLQILHTLNADLALNLTEKQVYSAFNPETMQLLKWDSSELPVIFTVDENDYIQPKTIQEQLQDDDLDFSQVFNTQQLNQSQGDSKEGGVQELLDFVLDQDLINSLYKAEIVLDFLVGKLEQVIQVKYSQGMEFKILKAYIDWRDEDKPENDARQAKYLQMKRDVEEIKLIHKPMMNRVKKIMVELNS